MIALLCIALALYALRGLAEYLVSADLFGWRVPSWYSRSRVNNWPGWIPFRDDFHVWQFVRNRAANAAPCFVIISVTSPIWYHAVILYAVSEVLWIVGHGITFSALARWYAKTSTLAN
jgi:hypothetical protein